MGTKGSLFLTKLKQKFMARWECHDLGETAEFLSQWWHRDVLYMHGLVTWLSATLESSELFNNLIYCNLP